MYKLQLNKNPMTGETLPTNMVIKDDKLWIPFDEQNPDYQEYLRWLEEGNTPLPADPIEIKE
jgi:hypothetical protein